MNSTLRNIAAIVLTCLWVNASEFLRNELFLKRYWIDHYQALGMVFPSTPLNGMVWGLWGFLFAISIFLVSRKFNFVQTALISWLMGFVLMWIVIWNMGVLPTAILIYAVPLSLLEVLVGTYLCKKVSPA